MRFLVNKSGFTLHHFKRNKSNGLFGNIFHRNMKNGEGLTLVEILVIIAIMILLSAIILPGYQQGKRQLALARSARKLAQDLRRTQEMGMSAREFGGIVPEGGYGIYFSSTTPSSYILFADYNPQNQQYDGLSEMVEGPLELEKGVESESLNPPQDGELAVVFTPPIPLVFITPDSSSAFITLTNDGQSSTVRVNKAGLIEVID